MYPPIARLYTTLFYRDRWYASLTTASLVLAVLTTAFMISRRDVLYLPGESLALHYKVFFGIDFLADWYYVAAIPAAILGVTLLNYALGHRIYTRQKQSTYLLMGTAVAVGLALMWAAYLIVAVNIF